MHTRCYRDGRLVDEGFPIAAVSDHLENPANTVWFDLCSPTPEELDSVREELGLHSLAIEDAQNPGQRPKLDHYPSHLFLVAYAAVVDESGRLGAHEVSVFITEHALVTVRADEGFDIDEVMRRWDDSISLAGDGVAYLLHGLLDYVVDTHYTAVQRMDTEVDDLEDQLFDEQPVRDTQMQRRTFGLRKDLVALRRIVLPMREVVNSLLRRDLGIVPQSLTPYFQDVYDHVLRVSEWTDSLRDLLANILETRLTLRGNQLNVVMKQVTSWAAIIAVPTAVTGFYGQNVPYPGHDSWAGFIVSTVVIVGASLTLYLLFRRRGWI